MMAKKGPKSKTTRLGGRQRIPNLVRRGRAKKKDQGKDRTQGWGLGGSGVVGFFGWGGGRGWRGRIEWSGGERKICRGSSEISKFHSKLKAKVRKPIGLSRGRRADKARGVWGAKEGRRWGVFAKRTEEREVGCQI